MNGGKGYDTVILDGDYSAGVDVRADRLVNVEHESVGELHDTIDGFTASGGCIELGFDADTTVSGFQRDFHLGRTADRVGDIVVKYDATADETIVKVFTDHDKIADFVVHLTGDVQLTTADFIFG